MAPTIDDVLKVLSRLEKGQEQLRAELRTGQEELRAEVATLTATVEAIDEKVDLVRGILLSTRRDTSDLRDDVDAIHKGLMKAKPHDVPKDLPSQVRAKTDRPSKPAKRAGRRR